MFEYKKDKKASYNKHPNRRAGDQLRARGQLAIDDEVRYNAWNSTTLYPNPTEPLMKLAARECDFWKFRGRGLVQVTWRNAYEKIVNPLLAAKRFPLCDALSEMMLGAVIQSIDDISIPMVKGLFQCFADQFAEVDQTPPNWAALGKAVSGRSAYGKLLQWRCETLRAAMLDAGYETS